MLKQIFFSRWDILRTLRLIFGIIAIATGITHGDTFAYLIGGFFIFQSIFNVGCCSSAACYTDIKKPKKEQAITDVEFEEIKS